MALTLLHHWDFHEGSGSTVADIASGNDGTIRVSTLFGDSVGPDGTNMYWTTGRNGGDALACNGSVGSDYDRVTTTTQYAAESIGAYTIAVWFKQSAAYAAPCVSLETDPTGWASASAGNQTGVYQTSGNYGVFGTNVESGVLTPAAKYQVSVADGNWHHLVHTSSSTGAIKLYLNNVQVATGNNGPYTGGGYWRMFGTKQITGIGTASSFAGVIDDVRIYLGEASDQDVDDLYNDREIGAARFLSPMIFGGGLTPA